MISLLIKFFNILASLVLSVCSISAFVGFVIVRLISTCVSWIFIVSCNIWNILQALWDGFTYFLIDVYVYLQNILHGVCEYLNILYYNFNEIQNYINVDLLKKIQLFFSAENPVIRTLFVFYTSLQKCLITLFQLIIDSLCLIGTCSKELVKLIITFIHSLITSPIFTIVHVILAFGNQVKILYSSILCLPLESGIGLLVILALIYIYVKYQGNKIILYALNKGKSKLYHLWYYTTVLFALFCVTLCTLSKQLSIKLISLFTSTLARLFSSLKGNKRTIESLSKDQLVRMLEKEAAVRLCVICMENQRDVILLGCHHFCMCKDCAILVKETSNECPICRKVISRMDIVYT